LGINNDSSAVLIVSNNIDEEKAFCSQLVEAELLFFFPSRAWEPGSNNRSCPMEKLDLFGPHEWLILHIIMIFQNFTILTLRCHFNYESML
jgi:hypothetical protein